MPETEKLTSVPSVPALGVGQVGQSALKADHPRDSGGTVDLKALAFKVLQKANAGQAWDKQRDRSVPNPCTAESSRGTVARG